MSTPQQPRASTEIAVGAASFVAMLVALASLAVFIALGFFGCCTTQHIERIRWDTTFVPVIQVDSLPARQYDDTWTAFMDSVMDEVWTLRYQLNARLNDLPPQQPIPPAPKRWDTRHITPSGDTTDIGFTFGRHPFFSFRDYRAPIVKAHTDTLWLTQLKERSLLERIAEAVLFIMVGACGATVGWGVLVARRKPE